KDVIDRFAAAEGIKIQPATADRNGQVQKVPPAAPHAPPRGLDRVMASALPDARALARVDVDLAASEAGRRLRALWADHHAELLDLVEHRRPAPPAWQ